MSGDWDTVGHCERGKSATRDKVCQGLSSIVNADNGLTLLVFASRGVSDEPHEKVLNVKLTRVQEAER